MYKFLYFMMVDSTETKSGESGRTTAKMRIPEIVSSKITDRNLMKIITCSESG